MRSVPTLHGVPRGPVKRRLKLMAMLLMLSAGSGAKDLGTWGNVFEPAEQDMLAFIQNRLKGMEQTGELDRLRREATDRVKEHAVRPMPVEGLTKAKEYRSFAWDPTFTVKETITDMQGNVIARKGDTVNPWIGCPSARCFISSTVMIKSR